MYDQTWQCGGHMINYANQTEIQEIQAQLEKMVYILGLTLPTLTTTL